MHPVSLSPSPPLSYSPAVVPDHPQAGTALMNEVTLRNAYIRARRTRHSASVYTDLRSGRAAFRRFACRVRVEYAETEKERKGEMEIFLLTRRR